MRVARLHDSGLVVAEDAMDEAAVSRALKRLDDRLVLQKHRADVPGGYVYKVLKVWSESHPAAVVFTWMDKYGRPLPLSSGLVDEMQRHMLGARNFGPDADEHNRLLVAERERFRAREMKGLSDWYRPHLERGRVGVSFADVTKKPLWARKQKRL